MPVTSAARDPGDAPDSAPEPIRVLMVEDNPADVELVLRQLDRDGL
jgi:hypothetical protein